MSGIDGTYYVIKRKRDGQHVGPAGVSKAPHLYDTKGKANGKRKGYFGPDNYEVVPVQLTELKEGVQE